MDLATIIGLVLGTVLVMGSILLGGNVMSYVDVPSVMIVIGGALASTMMAFPLARFFKMPSIAKKVFFNKSGDPLALITQLVELAELARRDGILALENVADQLEDEFLVTGIRMAVDGSDPETIETVLETELENLIERHAVGKGLLDAMGRYAPAFGMIGTLIGLIAMLSNMDDPSQIGAGMAVALLTTLYGAMLANVCFLPMADKLALLSGDEILMRTIIIQGVMAIQAGDNPRNVQSKLLTFIPPAMRPTEDDKRAAA